jgi:polyribonucleotide nucleotidyltransferase
VKICSSRSFSRVSSREARPSDSEVLTMRLVDRVLRPLFPDDYHAEVQVMIHTSYDEDVMPWQ